MRLRITLACCAALVLSVGVATASSANRSIIIDGHFTETYPQGQGGTGGTSPHLCFNGDFGSGMLKGFGKACEQFTFESFDGFICTGSGEARFHSAGAVFNGFYTGVLTLC